MNLPELSEVLDEIEFFERERMDGQVVKFWKAARVLGWIGVKRLGPKFYYAEFRKAC